MKTFRSSLLRSAALATTLFVVPSFLAATETNGADRAAQLLSTTGRLPVHAAGPYVEVGTYQVQVAVKLGRASTVLPDGTWLYENFVSKNSAAKGTLVVHFVKGQVSQLYLAAPAIVAALKDPTRPAGNQVLVASHDRR